MHNNTSLFLLSHHDEFASPSAVHDDFFLSQTIHAEFIQTTPYHYGIYIYWVYVCRVCNFHSVVYIDNGQAVVVPLSSVPWETPSGDTRVHLHAILLLGI